MAKASYRGCSLHLQGCEFSVDYLSIDDDGLEVSQFVLKLSLLIFTTEEVDSLLNRVTL